MANELDKANEIADRLCKAARLLVRDADTEDLMLLIEYWDMRNVIVEYLREKGE